MQVCSIPTARLAILIGLLASMLPASVFAASDIYMDLGDIEGESRESMHEKWVNIDGFQFGQVVIDAQSVKGRKSYWRDVTIQKQADSATSGIMKLVASGQTLKEVTFDFVTAGQERVSYYQVKLSGVIFRSSVISGDSGGDRPRELVTLQFEKIEWTYVQYVGGFFKLNRSQASWDILNSKGTGGKAEGLFKVKGTSLGPDQKLTINFPSQANVTYRILASDKVTGPFVEVGRVNVSEDKDQESIELPPSVGNRFVRLEAVLQ